MIPTGAMSDVDPAPCPHCHRPATPVTCACRGCADLVAYCDCDAAADDSMAWEGLCPGCRSAGCIERLAEFQRCARLR